MKQFEYIRFLTMYFENKSLDNTSWYFQIKNNSMKKLAATTLMEILPGEMQNMVDFILTLSLLMWILEKKN